LCLEGTHIFNTNVVEGLCNLHLGLGGKVGSGKLLSLAQGGVDDLEVGKTARASHRSRYRGSCTVETGKTVAKGAGIIRFVIVFVLVGVDVC
jgi:hypothetical protein